LSADKLFVDLAGDHELIDGLTGEIVPVQTLEGI
jgi:hypothetical protein